MASKTPKQIGDEAAKKAECFVRSEMIKANLGLDRGLEKLSQLLECTKPVAATVVRKSGKSKEQPDADSTTCDFIEVPDNAAQAKALDMLFSLGDYYPDKKLKAEVNHSGSIMAAVAAHLSDPQKPTKKDTGRAKKAKPKRL